MRAAPLLITALLTLASPAMAEPVEWQLDPAHTTVGFVARHLGFAKVKGDFRKFEATAKAEAKTGKLTELQAVAQASSVNTGNEQRDEHLRSDDFFGAAEHPTLKLNLKSIEWKDDAFKALVGLTLRGVTKDVVFTGEQLGVKTVNFGRGPQLRTAYEATGTINRKEFGLKFNKLTEGVSIVGDDVDIVIEASLWRKAGEGATKGK